MPQYRWYSLQTLLVRNSLLGGNNDHIFAHTFDGVCKNRLSLVNAVREPVIYDMNEVVPGCLQHHMCHSLDGLSARQFSH